MIFLYIKLYVNIVLKILNCKINYKIIKIVKELKFGLMVTYLIKQKTTSVNCKR